MALYLSAFYLSSLNSVDSLMLFRTASVVVMAAAGATEDAAGIMDCLEEMWRWDRSELEW